MSIQAHLAELERKHQALEEELSDALAHPSVDDTTIAELKRRKLQVKDEIARLNTRERSLRAAIIPPRRRAADVASRMHSNRRLWQRVRRFCFTGTMQEMSTTKLSCARVRAGR